MKKELAKLRKNYNSGELNEDNLINDPFLQFDVWFKEALKKEPFEPYAMVISTTDQNMKPSSRVVLLKDYSEKDFIFFTNYKSRKGEEIKKNSNVSLLFYWPKLQRQVRIEGNAKKVSKKISDKYFNSRPVESRVGAIISKQSKVITDYTKFKQSFEETLKDRNLKRPIHWGGYAVIPSRFEFWQGRPGRLHDRFRFEIKGNKWEIDRLFP